jgi:3-oxoacyl-[acyl-carrier protein] reductase
VYLSQPCSNPGVDLGLEGRLYVVGGGSRGLGRAVADELVREGARVVLVARDGRSLDDAAAELGNCATCAADLADPAAVARIAAAVDELGGSLDGILVNHGGPTPGNALDLSDDDWRRSFELVLGGPIRLLRELQKRFSDGASVLFVTSSTVRAPVAGLDTSNVLRPGVAGLVKVLAQQLAPRVRVNGLGPGRFMTERGMEVAEAAAAQRGITVEQQLEEIVSAIPFGRKGDPVEFGRLAAFVLSPAASYLTGVNMLVDGGMVSALP